MEKSIVITEKAIYDITYHQVAELLNESCGYMKFPLFNDWWIKMGDNTWGEDSDNIWGYAINLYNGDEHITTINPFEYCMTYAVLAKGDVDCVGEATEEIIDTIKSYKEE